jgi:hypothetical protein
VERPVIKFDLGSRIIASALIDGPSAKLMTKGFQEFLRGRIESQLNSLLLVIDDLKKLMASYNLNENLNRKKLESVLG